MLREEFVEKKYQVFDTIDRLLMLVQVNPSSPVERVEKSWNFGSQQATPTSVRRLLSVVLYVVYKNYKSSAVLPGCTCAHSPTRTRVKPPHTLYLCFTGSGTLL